MRPWILTTLVLGGVALLLAVRQVSMSNQLRLLREQNEQAVQKQQSLNARLESAEQKLASQEDSRPSEGGGISSTGIGISAPSSAQIAALENQIRVMQAAISRQPAGLIVPEYDVTNPVPEPEPPTNAPPKRSWGTEQVLGPPDTPNAGDAPTAWASLEATAGAEWLALGFDTTVELAQIRIRETYNPGAISKVTTVVNGAEVVLWEGTAAKARGMRDFIVPVSGGTRRSRWQPAMGNGCQCQQYLRGKVPRGFVGGV